MRTPRTAITGSRLSTGRRGHDTSHAKRPGSRGLERCGSAALLLSLLSIPLHAQQAATEASAEPALEEVVVSARKTEENLQRVGTSVVALTEQQLQQQRVDAADDLPRFVPNLVMKKRSGSAGDGLTTKIRGIGTSDIDTLTSDPSVGVYVDGVFQTRAFGPQFDLFDVERVEVLRGPQGTLYGKNSLAGSINIVTRKPSDAPGGKVSAEFGNEDAWRFSGAVDVPLIEGKLLSRLSGALKKRDGFTTNVFNGADLNEENVSSMRLALRYLPSETLTADLTMDFLQLEQNQEPWFLVAVNPAIYQPGSNLARAAELAGVTDLSAFAVGMEPDPSDLRKISLDGGTGTGRIFPKGPTPRGGVSGNMGEEFNISGGALSLEWNATGNHVLKSITGFREFERTINRDVDGTPVQIIDQSQFTEGWTLTQELQLNSKFLDGKLDTVTGLFWSHDDLIARAANPFFVALADAGGLNISTQRWQDLDNDALAAFAHAMYHLSERVGLSAGLRYNWENKKARVRGGLLSSPDLFNAFDASGDITFSSVQPKVGLDYVINDDLFAYGLVSKGYASGGYNGRLTPGAARIPTVDEETLWNYEVGLKSQFFGGKARLNTAVFYMDYKDVVVQTYGVTPVGTIAPLLDNVGAAKVKGIEIDLLTRPVPALTLRASVGLLDREFTDVGVNEQGQPVDPDTLHFFDSPDSTFSAGAQYDKSLGELGALTFSANWAYQSKIYFDNDRALYSQQDAYSLVSARITWATLDEKLQVSLWGDNLTDTVYATRTFSLFNTMFGVAAGRFGDPRTVGMSFEYRW